MSHPLAVAALGFWHVHAGDYARVAQEHPGTTLVAIWDDDPERGREAAEKFGVEFVADLDELLARDGLDAVTVTTSTDRHRDVILRAIAAGKHVFTEKVLAPTVEEADELVAAADAAGVSLVVSLPRLYHGYTAGIEEVLDAGTLGDLAYSRVRLAHDGWIAGWLPDRFGHPAEAIGGALTDLGCHPAYLTRLFHRSEPLRINATYASLTGREVEDNAVVTAEFAGGRIGVFEASLVQGPGDFTIELRGTRGALSYGGAGGGLRIDTGDGWRELPVPDDKPGAFDEWVQRIHDGGRADANLDHALALTRMVVAANASAAEGRAVTPAVPAAAR
ncbi:Gfo/Idh/MocA family protein [Leifsonia shinshuensis]